MTERYGVMKEKKNKALLPIFLFICLCLSFFPVYAYAAENEADSGRPSVTDDAGLFTRDEVERLTQEARSKGQQIGAELAILTVDWDTGCSGITYAKRYLTENGYGCGSGRESILFLIDMYARDYTVYEYNTEASGYLLTDYEGDLILDDLQSDMRSGDYAEAAQRFLDDCVYYAGTDLGGNYDAPVRDRDGNLIEKGNSVNWGVSAVIGLIGGAVITGILVGSRNNNKKPGGFVYTGEKGMQVLKRRDQFTHTTVVERKIETQSDSGGGGSQGFSGGGSGGGHGGSRGF